MYPNGYRHEDDTTCPLCGEDTMTIGFSLAHRCPSDPVSGSQSPPIPETKSRTPVRFFSPDPGLPSDPKPRPQFRKTESRASVTHLWSGKYVRTAPSWKRIPLEEPPWELAECGTLGSGMSVDVDEVDCKGCKRTAIWKNSKNA